MPELPEVETVRSGLARLIVGKRIYDVFHDTTKSFPNSYEDVVEYMVEAVVTRVRRRAKALIIDLDTDYSLVVHLRMTGQMVFVGAERFGAGHPNDSLVGELPDRSTRVTIVFDDDSRLFFNDQRKFGWMRLMPTAEISNMEFFRNLGPEPLEERFRLAEFTSQLANHPNATIKATLLDQTVIAGIGNIYADEALWGARIHPSTRVKDVSPASLKALLKEIKYVLNVSIEKGGSSDKNYVNAEGKKGSYISFARVFRREGQPCPRCSTAIEKIRVAGRGTHVCPTCQLAPQ